ncbi:MAG: hypothetical protein JWR05_1276 [Mucilaginibacter sp.]|nr:hypothetical protein [Mucilaginibacter sp.]
MKTIYKPGINISTLIVILVTAFSACKKDNTSHVNIVGKWSKSESGYLWQYEFRGDLTYQSTAFATDPATSKVLGYRHKSTGQYRLKGEELTLYNITNYSNPNSYGPETSLIETNGPETETYYKAEVSNGKLSLFFTCGPFENCIASPIVYSKQ